MQKISNYLLSISPKRLAIYLLVYPLILVFLQIFLSIIQNKYIEIDNALTTVSSILLTVVMVGIILLLSLWFLWLKAITLSVEKTKLNLPIKWFKLAFGFFVFYVLFNLLYETLFDFIAKNINEYIWMINASVETINFVGLFILYPIICHYAARAIYVYKEQKFATFLNSVLYTLLLIFVPICIPFLHRFVSPIRTKQTSLIKIYTIGLGLIILIFVTAFIASILNIF